MAVPADDTMQSALVSSVVPDAQLPYWQLKPSWQVQSAPPGGASTGQPGGAQSVTVIAHFPAVQVAYTGQHPLA
jgi:hypothetical protein